MRAVGAGEALLLSYGPLGNDFLLLDYGFVMPDNPHDRIALRYGQALMEVAWMCPTGKLLGLRTLLQANAPPGPYDAKCRSAAKQM